MKNLTFQVISKQREAQKALQRLQEYGAEMPEQRLTKNGRQIALAAIERARLLQETSQHDDFLSEVLTTVNRATSDIQNHALYDNPDYDAGTEVVRPRISIHWGNSVLALSYSAAKKRSFDSTYRPRYQHDRAQHRTKRI